ncbi:MAG: hypothetical protein IT383_22070 [Deltaproteobacteria bacterium]|nr:hypothetical protein [Deltaproteobacteria bacterium]
MRIEFEERFALSPEHCYQYFKTPADWVRLYGAFGEVEDRGDGWQAVVLRGFPLPLVARVVEARPPACVRWEFGGPWRGSGTVELLREAPGVVIRGYEEIELRLVPRIAHRWLERAFMERRFRGIWKLGWRRLREEAASVTAP